LGHGIQWARFEFIDSDGSLHTESSRFGAAKDFEVGTATELGPDLMSISANVKPFATDDAKINFHRTNAMISWA